MGKVVKGIGNIFSPAKVKPTIADKGLFDISKEVKPAQDQYKDLLAASQANQAAIAPMQTQALTQMGQAALGQGPSLAEVQMKAAQDRNLAQQLAAVQAQRGGNAAMNQRALLQNMGASGRDIAQQSGIARMQERDNFLNQSNIANQSLRTDIGGQLNLDLMPKQSLQGWEMARVGAVNQAQAQNAAAKNALTGALIGGAGTILGGMATGGTGFFAKAAGSAAGGAAAGGLQQLPATGGMPGVNAKDGGPIKGPGTGTSDSIPANLSNGEFVIKAKVAQQPGMEALLKKINAGKVDTKQIAALLTKPKKKA